MTVQLSELQGKIGGMHPTQALEVAEIAVAALASADGQKAAAITAFINQRTSGGVPDTLLTVTVAPTGPTTQQQAAHSVISAYASTFPINAGGWTTSYAGTNSINSTAAIDKSVVYQSYTLVQGGAQVSKSLGFEAVMSGLDGTSNIDQYAGFYVANVAAAPNINRITTFYGFACDYAQAHFKSVGKYLKALNTTGGSVLKELAPPPHAGYVANRYYGPTGTVGAIASGGAIAAGVGYTTPYHVSERTTFTKIGVSIASALAGNLRLGIYYMENGVATALIAQSGDISTAAAVAVEATINVTLEAGTYALGVVASAGIALQSATMPDLRQMFGSTGPTADDCTPYWVLGGYGAFPANAPAFSYAANNLIVPYIWLRK